jgi:phosphopantothenoylcysteine synthetase/decarboxylase
MVEVLMVVAKKLVPDDRGRITLGDAARGVSSYSAIFSADGTVTLTPMVEIPARERWLWDNKQSLSAVQRGLDESAKGITKPLNLASLTDDEP